MVTNGYASKLEEEAAPLTQRVRLGIDLAEAGATNCYWINPETGKKESLEAIGKEDDTTYFQVDLQGGSGALFMVE